jgi:hypothetical protein
LVPVLLTPIKNNRRLALEVGQSSVEVALVPVQVQAAVQPTKKLTPRKKLASKPKSASPPKLLKQNVSICYQSASILLFMSEIINLQVI